MDNTAVSKFHFIDCSSVSVNSEHSLEMQRESEPVLLDPLEVEEIKPEINENGTFQVEDYFVDFPIDIEVNPDIKKIYNIKLESHPDTEPHTNSSASTVNAIPSQEGVVDDDTSEDKNNKPSAVSYLKCEELRPHKCETCHKRFNYRNELLVHEHTHSGEKPYVCKTCGKLFIRNGHLVRHERIHTGEKPFGCKTCNKSFTKKCLLDIHERLYSGEFCKTCGKFFTQKCHLVIHERTHTGEKPYVCKTCGTSFLRNSHLVRHEHIHSGENLLVRKTCGKSFSQNCQLIHEHIHNGEKLFVCKTCGKSLSKKIHLVIHERIHSGEKPFVC